MNENKYKGRNLIKRILEIIFYVIRFYVAKAQQLIPHPRLRSIIFKLLGAKIGHSVRIENVSIGNQIHWGFNNLEIGNYSGITQDAYLDLTSKILIGKKTVLAGKIYTHQDAGSFLFDSPTVRRYPRKVAPVIIGDNVYAAVGSIILCGVKVGDNSVVGAGSVVISDVPPNTLVTGVPAKVKKEFDDSDS
jgi:acetyltransferase-like isoleucine patch superfamily enzyme